MQTKHKTQLKKALLDGLVFLLGGSLYAIGVRSFTAGNHILNGGFTGIATILHVLWNFPIGTTVFLFNVPLFFLSFQKFGKAFVCRTFAATLLTSVLVDLASVLPVYQNDLLLASIIGGALTGAGMGLIFLRNATTGGVDSIAKLVRLKKPHVSMGKSILLFDAFVVLLGGLVFQNVESMLYAAVTIFVSTQVIDAILYGVHRGTVIFIISEKSEEIQTLLQTQGRGVTRLKAVGAYTKAQRDVLLCACLDHQASMFTKRIQELDKHAFLIVTKAQNILGNGFPTDV